MNAFINVDIADFKAHIASLFAAYPELAEDDELRADMIEGETNLNRIMDKLLSIYMEAQSSAAATKQRKVDIADRQVRFERKAEGAKALMKSVMQAADLPKLQLPEATVSITKPGTKVNVLDVNELPQGFFVVERKAKSAEIKEALEKGESIPGAELVLGDEGIMVRSR